ncbi:VWA domain-containing protein [Thalassotalea ponticola]|uniref:vWA domain-containing protein n=1 Tax=Thalassotalea ponticola TaxID=1523392 RepID=UPI0025B5D3E7|nr:VWA domain-containing protein [Thalassotalea ponticola]MDN3651647.1 VWA domain-containing protein [Thalassotalea ponticola]
MIEFAWPYLAVLLVAPLVVYWLVPAKTHAAAALKVPVSLAAMERSSTHFTTTGRLSPIWLAIIWTLLVVACMRPQWLGDPITMPNESREMIIAVDLSGSMKIEDMQVNNQQVNRLAMLKQLLGDFIERRQGDRLGLILFADDAYMQTPMTFDTNTVKQMLDEAVIGLVGQRTAIGDAIALAVKRFVGKGESNRVLVLLTDGQNTSGKISPEQALDLAKGFDVTVYTIGIGAEVMIERSLFGSRTVNPSRDLDEQLLKQIAEQTSGSYFRAKDGASMASIYQQLDQLEPISQEAQQMRPLTALYFYPLALACLLVLVAFIKVQFSPVSLTVTADRKEGNIDG